MQNTVFFVGEYGLPPIPFPGGIRISCEREPKMIQICYYKGCGMIYGEKEPLSDKRITHGLCPLHFEMSLKELKEEMEKLKIKMIRSRVLIVEDSTLFRQLLRDTLHDRFPSIQIDEAGDGVEALFKADVSPPDLVFMDIRLPGENGLEVTKKIKMRHPDVKVIILTGHDLPEYREASLRYADYFFSKDSSTTESILRIVRSVL